MADGTEIPALGITAADDEIDGKKYQRIKFTMGADGVNDGDVSKENPLPIDTAAFSTRLHIASSTISYLGKALPGTATDVAAWQIQKIDESSGMVKGWADGNSNFDNVWDDRESLSYS